MSADRSPAEWAQLVASGAGRALELFVFAPLGLAATARDQVPKLADEGRKQVERQLKTARFVGEFTVRRLRRKADAALVELGLTAAQRAKPSPPAATLRLEHAAPTATPEANGQSSPTPVDRADRLDPDELAIPGYDSLSASQVVQRLTGLSRPELEAVRAYEVAGRGRKTILTKVAQLQAATG